MSKDVTNFRAVLRLDMSSNIWNDYFDDDPFEIVGRQVEGAFGETITVSINRIDWAYLEWVEKELNGNVKDFIKQVERRRRPHDGERNEAFAGAVRQIYLKFEREGKRRPPWCAAAHPDDFDELEGLEDRE